jgi:hypothetical protein
LAQQWRRLGVDLFCADVDPSCSTCSFAKRWFAKQQLNPLISHRLAQWRSNGAAMAQSRDRNFF